MIRTSFFALAFLTTTLFSPASNAILPKALFFKIAGDQPIEETATYQSVLKKIGDLIAGGELNHFIFSEVTDPTEKQLCIEIASARYDALLFSGIFPPTHFRSYFDDVVVEPSVGSFEIHDKITCRSEFPSAKAQ